MVKNSLWRVGIYRIGRGSINQKVTVSMPETIRESLHHGDLMNAYNKCLPCRCNKYIGWYQEQNEWRYFKNVPDKMFDNMERGDAYLKLPYQAR